jgi:hypothetical protein
VIIEDLHNAIAALLIGDATFTGELTASIASGGCGLAPVRNVLSNRPIAQLQQLHAAQLPCWVLEPINADAEADEGGEYGVTIGNHAQRFRQRVICSLVWRELDRDTAYRQRLRIPERLVQLFLREDSLGLPQCEGALVRAIETDVGGTHPTQLLTVAIDAIVHINRS